MSVPCGVCVSSMIKILRDEGLKSSTEPSIMATYMFIKIFKFNVLEP